MVQFQVSGNGTSIMEASMMAPAGFSGALYDPVMGDEVLGPWASLAFTYAPAALPDVLRLELANDDGASNDDGITTDPTLTGQVGDPAAADQTLAEPIDVELDINGDNLVDATTTTDGTGRFSFVPAVASGPVTVRARTSRWDERAGRYVTGTWQTLSFTLQAPTPDPLVLGDIYLVDEEGLRDEDGATSHATIAGSVSRTSGSPVAYALAELDLDGDGLADGTVMSDPDGQFQFLIGRPADLPAGATIGADGSMTVALRARYWDADTGSLLENDWDSFSFTFGKSKKGRKSKKGTPKVDVPIEARMNTSAIHEIMLLRLNVLPPYSYDQDEGTRDVSEYITYFASNLANCLSATERYLNAWEEFAAAPSSDERFRELLEARREFITHFPFADDELSNWEEDMAATNYMRKLYQEEARGHGLSEALARFRNAVISIK